MQCCDWSDWSRHCRQARKLLGWTAGCKRTGQPGSCGLNRWRMEKTGLYWTELGAAAVENEHRESHLVCSSHKHSLQNFLFTMHGLNSSRNYSKLDSDMKHTKHLVSHLLWEYSNQWELLEVMARSCGAMLFYEILIVVLNTAPQLTRCDIIRVAKKQSGSALSD